MIPFSAQKWPPRLALLLPFLLYFLIGGAYAWRTPAWQSPDEPAHYQYVRQLAQGQWPIMQAGDYDQREQSETIGREFAPPLSLDDWQYEDYQPPLYYLLLLPTYWLTDGSLFALRLTSLLIGSGIIICTYLTAKTLTHRPILPLTITLFVALLPQHLAILASVNNDSLTFLLIALTLYALTRHAPPTTLTLLLALATLTKVTAYLLFGVVAITYFVQIYPDWRRFAKTITQLILPTLVVGMVWWGRNLWVYGGFDFLGTQAHDAIVTGQPTPAWWIAQFGLGNLIGRLFFITFDSFWGQFGWMAAPFPHRYDLPVAIFLLGGGFAGLFFGRSWARKPQNRPIWYAFLTLTLLNLTLYLVYNLNYVQHQGRYLFPSLIPITTLLIGGWHHLTTKISNHPLLPSGFCLALTLALLWLNALALFRILPCLHFSAPC